MRRHAFYSNAACGPRPAMEPEFSKSFAVCECQNPGAKPSTSRSSAHSFSPLLLMLASGKPLRLRPMGMASLAVYARAARSSTELTRMVCCNSHLAPHNNRPDPHPDASSFKKALRASNTQTPDRSLPNPAASNSRTHLCFLFRCSTLFRVAVKELTMIQKPYYVPYIHNGVT